MTIIRAPRPASGFQTIYHALSRDMRLSRRARGLLIEMLSHTDGWRTDAVSLAAAGTEGRDAIRATLRELEKFHYLMRVKSQDVAGRWSTTTYVFDRPATEDDLAALIGGPPADADEVAEGSDDDDRESSEWAREPVNAQVTPETGFQAPVNQASVNRRLETRTSVSQALTDRRLKEKKGGAVPGGSHHAREAEKPTAQHVPAKPAKFTTSVPSAGSGTHGRELDQGQPSYDKWGRTTPRCDRHLTSTADDPCRACGDARVEHQVAQKARDEDLARMRAIEARKQWAREAGDAPKPPDFWERASAS